jgi:hypothetical protein
VDHARDAQPEAAVRGADAETVLAGEDRRGLLRLRAGCFLIEFLLAADHPDLLVERFEALLDFAVGDGGGCGRDARGGGFRRCRSGGLHGIHRWRRMPFEARFERLQLRVELLDPGAEGVLGGRGLRDGRAGGEYCEAASEQRQGGRSFDLHHRFSG